MTKHIKDLETHIPENGAEDEIFAHVTEIAAGAEEPDDDADPGDPETGEPAATDAEDMEGLAEDLDEVEPLTEAELSWLATEEEEGGVESEASPEE